MIFDIEWMIHIEEINDILYKNIKNGQIDQQHNTKFAPADKNETSINSFPFFFDHQQQLLALDIKIFLCKTVSRVQRG